MHIVDHISSLYSDSWVVWTLFVLLFIALLNRSSETNIVIAFRNVTSHSERIYTSQTQSWLSMITSRVFCFGILAMAMMVLVYQGGAIRMVQYLQVLGIVGLVFVVQRLLLHLVGYVFVPMKKMNNAMEQYRVLRMLACMLLFPIVLLMINFPNPLLARILCGIVGGVYGLVLLGKCVQLFYRNILSILYILLYITILEILPIAVIVLWTQHVMA